MRPVKPHYMLIFYRVIIAAGMIFLSLGTYAQSQRPFIITIKTDLFFEIPTHPHHTYSYEVDWGDGQTDSDLIGEIYHTYDKPGTYTIQISGQFPAIYFNNKGDKEKILSVDQWGDIQWKNFEGAFSGCKNLDITALDTPDLSQVTVLSGMFRMAESLKGTAAFNDWDVGNVTNMAAMFRSANSFNQDIGDWNVSNVTDMSGMFGETSFNQDIGGWDVSSVTDMNAMFYINESFNQDIGGWDVSNVKIMSFMFRSANSFNQDLNRWDVSNVNTMYGMFNDAASFNQNIGGWDVSRVTDMSFMFTGASDFNQDIGEWNVSSVIDMSGMFRDTPFDQDIGKWDVSSVIDMSGMFRETAFNQDIGKWDVSSVADMNAMFYLNESFNQDIGDWNVGDVTDMSFMFRSAKSFNQDLNQWDVSNLNTMYGMFNGASSFNQNVGKWDVSNVTDMRYLFLLAKDFNQNIGQWTLHPEVKMEDMFYNSGLDCDHYSVILAEWQQNNPNVMNRNLGAENMMYGVAAAEYRKILIEEQGWTIEGDIASNAPCDALLSITPAVGEPFSEAQPLLIYPNPSGGSQVNIRVNKKQELRVFDTTGKQISVMEVIPGENTLYTGEWKPGVYFIRSENGMIQKLVRTQ